MRIALIAFFLALSAAGMAQVTFKTVVPREPVVAGESFQVQYVLENWDKQVVLKPASFDPFRYVTGPYNYPGTVPGEGGSRPVKNMVYTLEAGNPGVYVIKGATVLLDGQPLKSNDVTLRVISKQDAAVKQLKDAGYNPAYTLFPGEDAQEKIRKNLFVKVSVSKKTCYTGEPVLAVFKLYSRLQSRSDIIKNPGFYGFTIYDMVNLQDKISMTETVNGQEFDVHIIRKVQLFPLQAGTFTIDPMEIVNKVEFAKSAVRKKTEQQIAEGMMGGKDENEPAEGTTVVESTLRTEPISITVKPVPEKMRPSGYSGAAGKFQINASLLKKELAKNEEGVMEVTVTGSGNFIQLDAPAVQWPAGVEGFAPVIRDSLDKHTAPLSGSRTFRYSFICSAPGSYVLPPVKFSYFDTDSNVFHTISTSPLSVTGTSIEKKAAVVEQGHTDIAAQSEKKARIALVLVIIFVLLVLLYYAFRKKEKPIVAAEPPAPVLPDPEALLEPARQHLENDSRSFYKELSGAVWLFLQQRLGLTGSTLSKKELAVRLEGAGIGNQHSAQLLQLLELCETGMYTSADPCDDKSGLYQQTVQLLKGITIIS